MKEIEDIKKEADANKAAKRFSKSVLNQVYNESTAIQLMDKYYVGKVTAKDMVQEKATGFFINSIDDIKLDKEVYSSLLDVSTDLSQFVDRNLLRDMTAGSDTASDMSGTLCASTNYGSNAGAMSGDINLGSTGAELALTSDAIYGYIVKLCVVLDEANIKREGRWIVMNPAVAAYIETKQIKRIATANHITGFIGNVAGFDVYVTNHAFSFLNGADRIYTIIAGTDEYCSFASQITDDKIVKDTDIFGECYSSIFKYGMKICNPSAAAILQCKVKK